MNEKIVKVGLEKEAGYFYFVDKEGDISRAKMKNYDAITNIKN